MKKPVNMTQELRFAGEIKSCRITQKAGHWYAMINVEVKELEKKNYPKTSKSVGVDLGIASLITLSNSQKFENQKFYDKSLKKIRILNKKLSRSQPESQNREKVKLRLQRTYEKVYDARKDSYHKTVNRLLQEYDLVCIEKLNVAGMLRNHKLSRQLQDASFSVFVNILKYKATFHQKDIVQVGTFYPSTKLCSICNHKNNNLSLADRFWTCPKCGTFHDRDVNSAVNIEHEGLRIFNLINRQGSGSI